MVAQENHQPDEQDIAEKEAVDRLADDSSILADIEEEEHHQLAREEDHRTRRDDDAPRKLQVKDRGEVGLEEMHRPEGTEEHADAKPPAHPEERRHDSEIDGRLGEKQDGIDQISHARGSVSDMNQHSANQELALPVAHSSVQRLPTSSEIGNGE